MSASEVSPDKIIARVGENVQVLAGETIPDRALVVNAILAVPGTPSQLLRLTEVGEVPPAGPGDQPFTFSNLTLRGTKIYLRKELEAIRPLGFVLLTNPGGWRGLRRFVPGGLYQAWPNGRLFVAHNHHLVDAYTNQRLYLAKDRRLLPALIPVFIERWTPAGVAEEGQE